jgi:hypothetical protein
LPPASGVMNPKPLAVLKNLTVPFCIYAFPLPAFQNGKHHFTHLGTKA